MEDPDEYPPQHELHDIVERTQTALHERLEIADLDVWTTDGETGNYGFVLTLYPAGNVVAGCERTDASPERAWMHGEESHEFPVSEWMPPHGERLVFLTEGIESAKVTCWRWSTPARVTGR